MPAKDLHHCGYRAHGALLQVEATKFSTRITVRPSCKVRNPKTNHRQQARSDTNE
jgi:hypothetical protein